MKTFLGLCVLFAGFAHADEVWKSLGTGGDSPKLEGLEASSKWMPVYRLYTAALHTDRDGMLEAAEALQAPGAFPLAAIEVKRISALTKKGLGENQVLMKILEERDFRPLYALRRLDRILTREAGFFEVAGEAEKQAALISARDLLRRNYLDHSKHIIERLFALDLLGKKSEHQALLSKARTNVAVQNRAMLLQLAGQGQVGVLKAWVSNEVDALEQYGDSMGVFIIPGSAASTLQINAKTRTTRFGTSRYSGSASATYGSIQVSAPSLSWDGQTLSGKGIKLDGVHGVTNTIHAAQASIDIMPSMRIKLQEAEINGAYYAKAELDANGRLSRTESVGQQFSAATTVEAKRKIVRNLRSRGKSAKVLPAEGRYFAALELLTPHLRWRAPRNPHGPHKREVEKSLEEVQRVSDAELFVEAHRGFTNMYHGVSGDMKAEFQTAYAALHGKAPGPGAAWFTWTLDDPGHAEVAEAMDLLRQVNKGPVKRSARNLLRALERNNTVLTFDIPGALFKGEAGPVVMDVCNAGEVSFKVYKVKQPAELAWVCTRIGRDFIYRDFDLPFGGEEAPHLKAVEMALRDQERLEDEADAPPPPPDFEDREALANWKVDVDEARTVSRVLRGRHSGHADYDESRWSEQADTWYFDDTCTRDERRLDYRYHREHALSSWALNRVVEIPEEALAEAGAYILVAEANGQAAYAPLLVDPLSLTLRRCRDGVFALVSDAAGLKPEAGAVVMDEAGSSAISDGQGAAFLRTFAAGRRAIIAEHEGRYAIGGFGRVFEGIYDIPHRREWSGQERLARMRYAREERMQSAGFVYEDRHVLAAYTDRPVYRPGQDVHFKMLVRQLAPEGEAQGQGFRDADFDRERVLRLPAEETVVSWEAINPRGRTIARGHDTCTEFGTLSGSFRLNGETRTGRYAMRVRLAGVNRVLPDVFGVEYYRRPNVELIVEGVPEELAQDVKKLELKLRGTFFFGKPAAQSKVRVRLLSEHSEAVLAEEQAVLDGSGQAALTLKLGEHGARTLRVLTELTDPGGRVVSDLKTIRVRQEEQGRHAIEGLPGFALQGSTLQVGGTDAFSVWRGEEEKTFTAPCEVTLEHSGWHLIEAAGISRKVFAYQPGAKIEGIEKGDWVNLADFENYRWGESGGGRFGSLPVMALFENRAYKVGDTLRLLLYLPWINDVGRLVFALEGRTVVDYQVVDFLDARGPLQVVEIPVKERHTPNIYLQARVVSAGDDQPRVDRVWEEVREALDEELYAQDPRWCRIDVADPKARPGREKLHIAVKAERAEYLPGEEVRVDFQVTDLSGNPARAELSLSAVDASLYTFGPGREGQLASVFTSARRPRAYRDKSWRNSLGSWWAERDAVEKEQMRVKQVQEMMQKASALADAAVEAARPALRIAGEMPLSFIDIPVREDFRETAAWQPHLLTGEDGRASTSFTLPDSLTRYRLSTVGITKDSLIGTEQQASIVVRKPLSVQVYLPRFAVEGDRFLARGMIHNQSGKALQVEVDWSVDGGEADQVESAPLDIPAGGTVSQELWINQVQPGELEVKLAARGGAWSDAEARRIPVSRLGRSRTLRMKGRFEKAHQFEWPAGFSPQHLQVSLAGRQHIEVAHALEGLQGLIDYPHGCVEQTMSRFLPAVLVRHASQRWAIELPPAVEEKLPAVLERGLERLYNHQKKDGSWGWWRKGKADDRMTLYVMYGLVQCRAAGVDVDEAVLARGLKRIQAHLKAESLSLSGMVRAWEVLALAGKAERRELAAFADGLLNSRSDAEAFGHLALACRDAGLPDVALRCFARMKDWDPERTEDLALLLKCQLVFGEPLPRFFPVAQALTDQRNGASWGSTWQTAWAIDALSHAIPFVPPPPAATNEADRVEILLDEKPVLSETLADRTGNRVFRFDQRFPAGPPPGLSFRAEGDARFTWSVTAQGLQAFEDMGPIGNRLSMIRSYPQETPLTTGAVFPVRLQLELGQAREYVMVEDRIPAGCEFAGDWLEGGMAGEVSHHEFRDDRVSIFFDRLPAGRHELVYYLRAEREGSFHVLPGVAYPMYQDTIRGETGARKVEISASGK